MKPSTKTKAQPWSQWRSGVPHTFILRGIGEFADTPGANRRTEHEQEGSRDIQILFRVTYLKFEANVIIKAVPTMVGRTASLLALMLVSLVIGTLPVAGLSEGGQPAEYIHYPEAESGRCLIQSDAQFH